MTSPALAGARSASADARRRRRPPPALVVLAAVVCILALAPTIYLVVRAADADADALRLLFRGRTVQLLATTLVVCLGTASGAVLLGVPLAWLTARTDLPGRRAWTVLVVAPLAVPSYLLAYAFVAALAPEGMARDLLRPVGLDDILPSPYGLPGAILVLVLSTYPLVTLATRAALSRVDPAMNEAARSLGDGPLQAFLRATLPMLLPAIGTGALLAALYASSDFGSVAILRTDTFARAIASQYTSSMDRHAAALFSLVLTALAFLLVWMEARIRRRHSLATPHGSSRTPKLVRLGRWRWPAVGLCMGVVALALGLPSVTVAAWLVRGVLAGTGTLPIVEPTVASIVIGSSAAVSAMLLALPVALLLAWYPGPIATFVRGATSSAYAVPGISFALAVVFATLALVPDLYRSLPILVLAIAIRYLPLAAAPVTGSLMLIGGGLVESARSLGASPYRVASSILWPLVRPSCAAALALTFLTAVKELPLTLFLAPPGTRTLATRLWSDATEGAYASAAGPGAVLLIVSLLSVGLLLRSRGAPVG